MERLSCILGLIGVIVAQSAHAQSPSTVSHIVDGYSLADGYSVAEKYLAPRASVDATSLTQHHVSKVVEGFDLSQTAVRFSAPNRRLRVAAGYEFGWLQPRFTENVSVVVSEASGDQAHAFEHPFESTPRVWVGIENAKCTGLRARYWYLRTEAPTQVTFALAGATPLSLTIEGGGGNLSRTAIANIGDAMTSNHRIEMRTIDLEGTQRMSFARTETLASFGLRYAKMDQRAHAVATDGGGALTELVCQDLAFDGFGPTASVEVRRCLFGGYPLLSRLAFYGTARGSILFGKQEQQIVLVTAGGATLAEDQYVHDSLLPIAELVGGLQLAAQPFGAGLWTLRTGYRAESWFGAGGPVDTQSNVGLHGIVLSIEGKW